MERAIRGPQKLICAIYGSSSNVENPSPLSPYAGDAVALLGQLIRKARIERKLKAVDVTDRAGITRGLLRRIETGDPGCSIGAVFEVSTIVGVRLFDTDQTALSKAVETNREIMALLRKSVRNPRIEADDDF